MKKFKKNIVLIGMPGCGKTTIGRLLARKMKTKFYDVDEYIRRTEGKSIPEIFENGEDYFRDIESKAVEKIAGKYSCVVSTGGGVIKTSKNMDALKRNGIIIFVNRGIGDIIENLQTKNRPLLKDGKEKIYELYDERIDLYKKYSDFEIVNDSSLEVVVNRVYDFINSIQHI
ncbi:shikimate kinase [Brassicibacter mesophilus]|uniref:shikimate kinase n=1 Tax=Brassicibacter mesophilus TaxID=745119 RepID=UPI003D1C1977